MTAVFCTGSRCLSAQQRFAVLIDMLAARRLVDPAHHRAQKNTLVFELLLRAAQASLRTYTPACSHAFEAHMTECDVPAVMFDVAHILVTCAHTYITSYQVMRDTTKFQPFFVQAKSCISDAYDLLEHKVLGQGTYFLKSIILQQSLFTNTKLCSTHMRTYDAALSATVVQKHLHAFSASALLRKTSCFACRILRVKQMQQCVKFSRSIMYSCFAVEHIKHMQASFYGTKHFHSLLCIVKLKTSTAITGSYATVHQACHKATGEVRCVN
jgi:hypothetical protein